MTETEIIGLKLGLKVLESEGCAGHLELKDVTWRIMIVERKSCM